MQTGMDLTKITSKHVQYLHKKMCDCYGETAKSISLTCFMSNMMIFCIDLAATPSHMKSADEDRPLQLVSSGSVDFKLKFKSNVAADLTLYVIAREAVIISVGPTGVIESIDE